MTASRHRHVPDDEEGAGETQAARTASALVTPEGSVPSRATAATQGTVGLTFKSAESDSKQQNRRLQSPPLSGVILCLPRGGLVSDILPAGKDF